MGIADQVRYVPPSGSPDNTWQQSDLQSVNTGSKPWVKILAVAGLAGVVVLAFLLAFQLAGGHPQASSDQVNRALQLPPNNGQSASTR